MIRDWWRSRRTARDRVRAEAQRDLRHVQVDALIEERDELLAKVARLQSALASVHIQGWMHGQIVQRDRAAMVAKAEKERIRRLAEEPTATHATEKIGRADRA